MPTPFSPAKDHNCVILHDQKRAKWLYFRNPIRVYSTDKIKEVKEILSKIERATDTGLYAVGYLGYEAARAFDHVYATKSSSDFPLAWFGVYEQAEPFDLPEVVSPKIEDIRWKIKVSTQDYRQAIGTIKNHIQAGDTYQVNYTYRLQAQFEHDPWAYFLQIVAAQGANYSAYINTSDWTICSASPELFFTLANNTLTSRPMKGTAPRGLSAEQDQAQKKWLQQSEKNLAENLMIVDMVRNDIGKIAEVGSVKVPNLFKIEQYPTLWQLTSDVVGQTHASITEIFSALFPAASITGAPKASTMKIIDALEPLPRNLYTGCIGYLAPNRQAQFNVAIRTLLLNNQTKQAEYSVGGGITIDSDSRSELEECYTKARILNYTLPEFELLETLLWQPKKGFYLLEQHLERLFQSASYFAWQINLPSIKKELNRRANGFPDQEHIIRLLVSRAGDITLNTKPRVDLKKPYIASLASTPIDASNPFLYHKTTQRKVYKDALKGQQNNDVILWNEKEELTESSIANIVVQLNGYLYTPPVLSGLLPGVYRAKLLKEGRISERIIKLPELEQAEAIYFINSVRKMWPVTLS